MNASDREHVSPWQVAILAMSVFVLAALFVETVFSLPPDVLKILRVSDTVICFVFIGDFLVRLRRAESKAAFMKWGWIDLVSSIPTLDVFRWGRIARVVKILRILRAFRSTRILLNYFFARRAEGVFASALCISFTLVIFSAIAILNVEKVPDSNIKGAEDALWWAMATITTVGYGDRYPVTTEGRMLGAILMTVGVGLFGTFTGFVASWFLGVRQQGEAAKKDGVEERLERMERMLEEIRDARGKG
jgi:voltage-gated potassium channel